MLQYVIYIFGFLDFLVLCFCIFKIRIARRDLDRDRNIDVKTFGRDISILLRILIVTISVFTGLSVLYIVLVSFGVISP